MQYTMQVEFDVDRVGNRWKIRINLKGRDRMSFKNPDKLKKEKNKTKKFIKKTKITKEKDVVKKNNEK